jgi:hypothetical protein
MKRHKKVKYKQVKEYKHELSELGDGGWKLVAIDEGGGIFVREEPAIYEYRAVELDLRPKHEMGLQETIDVMVADGWEFVSAFQGMRAFRGSVLFRRIIE